MKMPKKQLEGLFKVYVNKIKEKHTYYSKSIIKSDSLFLSSPFPSVLSFWVWAISRNRRCHFKRKWFFLRGCSLLLFHNRSGINKSLFHMSLWYVTREILPKKLCLCHIKHWKYKMGNSNCTTHWDIVYCGWR